MVRGIDISHYNGLVDWKQYKEDFAYIKVSEGTVIDKLFSQQWRSARGETVRGAYHYFRPLIDPLSSARQTATFLDGDNGELPIALDIETDDNMKDKTIERAILWVKEYIRQTKDKVIVYSSPGFLSYHQQQHFSQLQTLANLCEGKIWLASYPFDKIKVTWTETMRKQRLKAIWEGKYNLPFPSPPKPFSRVAFFQFTGFGDPSLVDGHSLSKDAVDLNFYNGESAARMFEEFSIKFFPLPIEEQKMIVGRIKSFTNIRNGPYESYADIGDLPTGSTIEASTETKDQLGRTWYKLSKATNPEGGPILTTTGKAVSDVVAWCWSGNVELLQGPPAPPSAQKKVVKGTLHFDDGSTLDLYPRP